LLRIFLLEMKRPHRKRLSKKVLLPDKTTDFSDDTDCQQRYRSLACRMDASSAMHEIRVIQKEIINRNLY